MNSGRLRRTLLGAVVALCVAAADGDAQTRRRARPRRPATPPPPAVRTEPAVVKCPQVLGEGVRTRRSYCDVLVGRDPAEGIHVTIPPHAGPTTIHFDLHNRHTYSEEAVKEGKGYHRFTAVIGLLTLDNTLISRAAIQSEFRTQADLVERIGGGSGPSGLKAVAPTGLEPVSIAIPEEVSEVSILGEKLSVVRTDATDTFNASGRPMALVSNIRIEYRPAPPRPAAARPR